MSRKSDITLIVGIVFVLAFLLPEGFSTPKFGRILAVILAIFFALGAGSCYACHRLEVSRAVQTAVA